MAAWLPAPAYHEAGGLRVNLAEAKIESPADDTPEILKDGASRWSLFVLPLRRPVGRSLSIRCTGF